MHNEVTMFGFAYGTALYWISTLLFALFVALLNWFVDWCIERFYPPRLPRTWRRSLVSYAVFVVLLFAFTFIITST